MSKNLPASVRQLLTNKAKATNRPFQELLQYFAMERFLYRLAQSPHAGKFILKGALMFTAWGGPLSGPTKDIDLLARMDNAVEAVVALMREVCSQAVEPDGLVFDVGSVAGEAIKEDADYSGVRVTFLVTLQNARVSMQIDMGFGDIVTPGATMITLSRPTALTPDFGGDASKQTQWQAFLRKAKLDGVPTTLQAVIDDLAQFLGPVAAAIESGSAFDLRWITRGPWR